MKYISIIDNGINNLKSIVGAVNHFGFKTKITNDKGIIMNSSGINSTRRGIFSSRYEKIEKFRFRRNYKKFFQKINLY